MRTTKKYKSFLYNPVLRSRAKELCKAGILHDALFEESPRPDGHPFREGNETTDSSENKSLKTDFINKDSQDETAY